MKPEKSFGEIWSELTDEQSEYLKGYVNRQRIDAINTHEKVNAKQIEKLEADKEELLEALEKATIALYKCDDELFYDIYDLIQKHKQ